MQKAQLLSKQEIDAIFPTEDTLMLHTAILAELEVALAKPAEKQNVGEVFIKKVRTRDSVYSHSRLDSVGNFRTRLIT